MTYLDAQKFAKFLQAFGTALHAHGLSLGVDVASWNHIWNFTLLGSDSGIDTIYNMDTYNFGANMTQWTIVANKV